MSCASVAVHADDDLQIFNKMKAGMDNDEVENSAAQSPGLYCGTSGWKHIKPEEDDPLIAGKKLKDRICKCTRSEYVRY